jgi:hypothetical protein
VSSEQSIWIGTAFCALGRGHDQSDLGFRGAYVPFACEASDIVECCRILASELADNKLTLKGLSDLTDVTYHAAALTEYQQRLINRLKGYPVQFENVHYFKADG